MWQIVIVSVLSSFTSFYLSVRLSPPDGRSEEHRRGTSTYQGDPAQTVLSKDMTSALFMDCAVWRITWNTSISKPWLLRVYLWKKRLRRERFGAHRTRRDRTVMNCYVDWSWIATRLNTSRLWLSDWLTDRPSDRLTGESQAKTKSSKIFPLNM